MNNRQDTPHEPLLSSAFALSDFLGPQLASVRIKPLPPEDARFKTIQLDGYLNSGKIKGDSLRRDFVPKESKPLTISGVPFASRPDEEWNRLPLNRSAADLCEEKKPLAGASGWCLPTIPTGACYRSGDPA